MNHLHVVKFGVTHGLRGYFAVMYDEDGPIQSGIGSYETSDDAWTEAQQWARSEYGDYWLAHMDKQ